MQSVDQLTEDQKQEFKIAFDAFDKTNQGRLQTKEAVQAMKALGM